MGYTTDFEGSFTFNKPLDDDTFALLRGLAGTRRMKRRGLDPKFGVEGEFYFVDDGNHGQGDGFGAESKGESQRGVVDYNSPPSTQPSLWLQWTPTDDHTRLEWDGGEKFYGYVEWLHYLIAKILSPRGYSLTGEVTWQGEDSDDRGKIVLKNNEMKVLPGRIVYGCTNAEHETTGDHSDGEC